MEKFSPDLLKLIALNLTPKKQFGLSFVCKKFCSIFSSSLWFEGYRKTTGRRFPLMYYILYKYRNGLYEGGQKWDLYDLAQNGNVVNYDVMEDFPNGLFGQGWDMYFLSRNHSIINEIQRLDTSLFRNNFCYFCSEPKIITKEIFETHSKTYQGLSWSLHFLCRNAAVVTLDMVMKNPDGLFGEEWNLDILSMNPSVVTWDLIQNNPNGILGQPWRPSWISSNSNITWRMMNEKYVINGFCWDLDSISANSPNITWETVLNNSIGFGPAGNRQLWKLGYLSRNPAVVTWKIILDNPNGVELSGEIQKWNLDCISVNPSALTWKFFLELEEKGIKVITEPFQTEFYE